MSVSHLNHKSRFTGFFYQKLWTDKNAAISLDHKICGVMTRHAGKVYDKQIL